MSDPQDPVTPPPIPTYVPPAPAASSSGLADNVAAALAYITIIPAIVFLVLEPYNRIRLVRFHSFQSIALCVAAFLIQIAVVFAEGLLHAVPLSWMLFAVVNLVVGLGLFIAWIVAILKAYKGEFYKLPIIGDFAEKMANS